MAINRVDFNGNTLIDLTSTTATADTILEGYGAFGKDGNWIDGTATSGGGSSQGIYCGTTAPSSSTGSNGDIYFLMSTDTSVEAYPANYTSSSINSTSYLSKCIGVSAEDGSATNNVYSSSSGTTGHVYYTFDLSAVPSNATISSVTCDVMAHEENSSRSSFTLQLYCGSTAKGSATTVSGTSNTVYSLTTGSWTRSEIDDLQLVMAVGYYGGLIAGATLTVSYEASPEYSITLTGGASSWAISGSNIYQKSSGSWAQVSSVTLDDLIERK